MPANPREHEIRTEGLDRLVFFSDAVFAIAITLLILDIHLPSMEGPLDNAQLLGQLAALWPRLFAYLLSFFVVAVFWVKHHTAFRYIKAYDTRLIWLNMLLLLVVSFIPFPTAVMSAQSNGVAAAFYSLTMAVGCGMSALIWRHATRSRRLVSDDLDPNVSHVILVSSILAGCVFLLAAGIDMVNVQWGMLALLLLIPVSNSHLWNRNPKRS